MPDFNRTRDCIVHFMNESTTVVVDDNMVGQGWPGGQIVQWTGAIDDNFVVDYARGLFGGILIWGSNEDGDRFTATTENQPHYRFATMLYGMSLISTSSYERYTLASRLTPPLVPIVYEPNQPLYPSIRGLWTNEDELTASADPEAPAMIAGYVAQVPKSLNNFYLGIQTAM